MPCKLVIYKPENKVNANQVVKNNCESETGTLVIQNSATLKDELNMAKTEYSTQNDR